MESDKKGGFIMLLLLVLSFGSIFYTYMYINNNESYVDIKIEDYERINRYGEKLKNYMTVLDKYQENVTIAINALQERQESLNKNIELLGSEMHQVQTNRPIYTLEPILFGVKDVSSKLDKLKYDISVNEMNKIDKTVIDTAIFNCPIETCNCPEIVSCPINTCSSNDNKAVDNKENVNAKIVNQTRDERQNLLLLIVFIYNVLLSGYFLYTICC